MKRILVILIALLCLCSCERNYKCVLKYQVVYPDTTWTHTYIFDGSWEAHPVIYKSTTGRITLSAYPYATTICTRDIAAVPPCDGNDIRILSFKIYRYGIDIPDKKNQKRSE